MGKKLTKNLIGLVSLSFLIVLSGCSSPKVYTPDMIPLNKGTMLEAPKDGWFVSVDDMDNLMEIKTGRQ